MQIRFLLSALFAGALLCSSTSMAENPLKDVVKVVPEFGYALLDPTTDINTKQLLILKEEKLQEKTIILSGSVIGLLNAQTSNREGKFGWLMRHPTASNQRGTSSSEAVIHSAQLAVTGRLNSWISAEVEFLFNPEQSFGAGTNTVITRNLTQVRRAYVLFGNLDRFPVYASLGKMAMPFGLTDTVSPFTASSVWHTFGTLANGAVLGYHNNGLDIRLAAIQGGAQFRNANTPVDNNADDKANVPSKLNNFGTDIRYTLDFGDASSFMFGGSYQSGTAYCQGFPVQHFNSCDTRNPGWMTYAKGVFGNLTLIGEFGRTTNVWPGTENKLSQRVRDAVEMGMSPSDALSGEVCGAAGAPSFCQSPGTLTGLATALVDLADFPARQTTSFGIGAKYTIPAGAHRWDLSAEFSRFQAGAEGSPWENQDQIVLGVAWFPSPSVKIAAEGIRTDGYAPLNFISGFANGTTHSDITANSNIITLAVNLAF